MLHVSALVYLAAASFAILSGVLAIVVWIRQLQRMELLRAGELPCILSHTPTLLSLAHQLLPTHRQHSGKVQEGRWEESRARGRARQLHRPARFSSRRTPLHNRPQNILLCTTLLLCELLQLLVSISSTLPWLKTLCTKRKNG
jgi:hypothetical protein